MLHDKDVTATIAVKDIERARHFYEDVVGLTPLPASEPGVVPFKSGASSVLVYQSDFAGTNKATAATWMLDDELEDTVRTLKGKGVSFEHYDMPGVTRQGDVHVTGKSRAAWFKDPDGNIIALVGR
jgi:catechol 2,3-dioxygenase-like lactoylglutathione lyase family enzyme